MDTQEAFDVIRTGIQAYIKDGHDQEAANMALAISVIAEELLSKLERIAVAVERSADTTR